MTRAGCDRPPEQPGPFATVVLLGDAPCAGRPSAPPRLLPGVPSRTAVSGSAPEGSQVRRSHVFPFPPCRAGRSRQRVGEAGDLGPRRAGLGGAPCSAELLSAFREHRRASEPAGAERLASAGWGHFPLPRTRPTAPQDAAPVSPNKAGPCQKTVRHRPRPCDAEAAGRGQRAWPRGEPARPRQPRRVPLSGPDCPPGLRSSVPEPSGPLCLHSEIQNETVLRGDSEMKTRRRSIFTSFG